MSNLNLLNTTDDKFYLYEALNSTDAVQIKDAIGSQVKIAEVMQVETTNKDGEGVVSTTIIGEDGTVYNTLSPTIHQAVMNLNNVFGGVKGITIEFVNPLNPKSNRRFLSLKPVR